MSAARFGTLVGCMLLAWGTIPSAADEIEYATLSVGSFEFTDTRPDNLTRFWPFGRGQRLRPYVVMDDSQVECYGAAQIRNGRQPHSVVFTFRLPANAKRTGTLIWPDPALKQMNKFRIAIPVKSETLDGKRTTFLKTQLSYYQELQSQGIPGAAWYRHRVRQLRAELGMKSTGTATRRQFFGNRTNSVQDTFALLSGGRALSENLQLDRVLPGTTGGEATVPLSSIEGITVREFDWQRLVKGINPKLDRLANKIPADQHALFFPSFAAMVRLADQASEQGAPVLALAEPQAVNANTLARYQRQLGVELDQATRAFGPALIKSVVLTGGDPYLRTGSDVAIVMEASSSPALGAALLAKMATAFEKEGIQAESGRVDDVTYQHWSTPDRSISSYLATLGKAVVITNSKAQLQRLVETHKGTRMSLSRLDEYRYFRNRYQLREGGETAFLMISDATIRRWCGPRWRIATSRRTRAMATVAELQARFAKEIADGKVKAGPIHVQQEKMPVAGALTLEPAGVRSETYGSLAFQTPVIEMDFDSVSTQEARLYRRWRDGYQRNWSNFFDPIGIQFRIDGKKIAADVTVMPLIDTSEYRELIDITRNGKLKPTDGDPHADVLMHWVLALNKKSGMLQMGRNVFQTMVTSKLDPLSWIGDHVAVYFDDDKQWEELAKIKDMEELSEELSKHFFKLPIGVHLDVSNGFKLTLFLTAVKAYIEQAAPGMTIWENREHAKVPYVRIAGSERAKSGRDPWEEMAIYYLVSGKSLVLSLNEDVIHRAIDRQVAKKSPDAKSPPRWLGKNVALTVDAKMLRIVSPIVAEEFQQRMQTLAFNNLPILNEWKKRFPDDDPVAVHQRIWKTTLICPAGGQYVWNDEWQTMESTIYGHPARPKKTRKLPTTLESLENGSFGLTFEPNGLRARVQLKRK